MKLFARSPGFLAYCLVMMMMTLQLHMSEASLLKKLKLKKEKEVCWEEKTEQYCSTTYENVCEQSALKQCDTEYTEKCTVDYMDECVEETEEQCVMETKTQCETESKEECWDEVEKDCRTSPKCNTVYEEVCSVVNKKVCPKKKHKREIGVDPDDFEPALVTAVDMMHKVSTKDLLRLCDELSEAGKPSFGEHERNLVALKYVKDFMEDDSNQDIMPAIVQINRNYHERIRKERSAESLMKKLVGMPKSPDSQEESGFANERSKRSSGIKDLIHMIIAGKKDCEEVPREHCTKIPVEKCHDAQSCEYTTHTRCKEVPHERCWEEPHQRCWDEPKQRCWQEPHQRCWQEPHEKCWEEPAEVCHEIPREKCEEVKVQVEAEHCNLGKTKKHLGKHRKKRDYLDEEKFDSVINKILDLMIAKGIDKKY